MSTVREVVSRVRSAEKLLSADAIITDRVIARELKSSAVFYIKREIDRRRLWQSSTIFTNIPCLEMIEVPASECCDYVSDIKIARSKYRLSRVSEGVYGLLIHGVFSVDNRRKIKEVTLSRFINLLKLNLPYKDVYYWFYDQYLYVSSPFVKVVNIWAYFEEEIPDEILYPDCPCNAPPHNPCINPLDLQFKCPGYLEDTVVKSVARFLLETYFKIPADHTSDNKDDQVNKT
jgi:hypothetical protein